MRYGKEQRAARVALIRFLEALDVDTHHAELIEAVNEAVEATHIEAEAAYMDLNSYEVYGGGFFGPEAAAEAAGPLKETEGES
jgi:hypothetical protein